MQGYFLIQINVTQWKHQESRIRCWTCLQEHSLNSNPSNWQGIQADGECRQRCKSEGKKFAISLICRLLNDFTCVILVDTEPVSGTACDVISSVVARLQAQHPNVIMTISGDFNHTSFSAILPTFQQLAPNFHFEFILRLISHDMDQNPYPGLSWVNAIMRCIYRQFVRNGLYVCVSVN